jgi:hypothetical protein
MFICHIYTVFVTKGVLKSSKITSFILVSRHTSFASTYEKLEIKTISELEEPWKPTFLKAVKIRLRYTSFPCFVQLYAFCSLNLI